MMDQLKTWKEDNNINNPDGSSQFQVQDQLNPGEENTPSEEGQDNGQTVANGQQSPIENTVEGEEAADEDTQQGENDTNTKEVVLYFASADGASLEAELRSVNAGAGIARAAINELIAGPSSENLYPTIPAATILEDINITSDGLCIVDFSPELIEDHPGGSLAEQLTVYSIVNTLSQFDSVDKVQMLVGGQVVDTLAGHCDITEAMARYDDIIK